MLLPALTFHQLFEGVALGARLVDSRIASWLEIILAIVYTVAASVGVLIGIGVRSSFSGDGATTAGVTGTLDALSAGIILYVAFVHMLGEAFKSDVEAARKRRHWWWRVLALFLAVWAGAGVMTLIGIWV